MLPRLQPLLEENGLGKYTRLMNKSTEQLIYSRYSLCDPEKRMEAKKIPLKKMHATQTERYTGKQLKATMAGERCFPVLTGTFQENGETQYYIIDGHHRTEWYLKNEKQEIPAIIMNTDRKPPGLCYPFQKFLNQPIMEGGGSDSPYAPSGNEWNW